MAFKHNAGTMKSRYDEHQSLAKNRLSKTNNNAGWNQKTTSQGSGNQTDVKDTHKPLPRQTAPGVNRNMTVQKDINTGTMGAKIPMQSSGTFMNKKTLQGDLHGSSAGAHKPGAK